MKTRLFFAAALSLCLMLIPAAPVAASDSGSFGKFGVMTQSFKDETGARHTLASIPLMEGGGAIVKDFVYITGFSDIQWGVKGGFMIDSAFGLGTRVYPFKKVLGLYGTGKFGTFLFNNVTLSASAGADLEIPVGNRSSLSIGAGVFTRKVHNLAAFIDREKRPEWYASGHGVEVSIAISAK